MKVLSHRGYWTSPAEMNTVPAFARSFALGFGTASDVRDSLGELVISHDMPRGGELTLAGLLHLAARRRLPLALELKAGGLAHSLAGQMRGYPGEWFVFDMSVPDLRAHLAAGNPVFTRLSDIEPHPACLDACTGVWLDTIERQWFGRALIEGLLNRGKQVCIVSPELHGRDPMPLWTVLRSLAGRPGLMLCTDEPDQARQHFNAVEACV